MSHATTDQTPHLTHVEVEIFTVQRSNERTFLSWIRTSTALMGFGFAIARFAMYLDEKGDQRTSSTYGGGLAMTLAGLIAIVLSTTRYATNARQISRGRTPRTHQGYLYTFALLVSVTGLVLLLLLLGGA